MLKRIGLLALLVCVAGSLFGCASAKKKFIRKTAEKPVQAVVYTEEEYSQKYSNKYQYSTHYTYWKTWQSELMNSLGQNAKREKRAAEEAISHLEGMKKYLIEPKKTELESEVNVLKDVLAVIDRGAGSMERVNLTNKLERSGRIIGSNFYYNKVKAFIAPDEVDLSKPQGPGN